MEHSVLWDDISPQKHQVIFLQPSPRGANLMKSCFSAVNDLQLQVRCRHRVLFGVLGLVGAIAFLCSDISPIDDDIQPEVFFTPRLCRLLPPNCRTAGGVTHRSNAKPATVNPPKGLPALGPAVEATLSEGPGAIMTGIRDSMWGFRSPPDHS